MIWFVILIGILSGYGQEPTQGMLDYRGLEVDDYDFFMALDDCDLVGREVRMTAGEQSFNGIVYDCAGDLESYRWMNCEYVSALLKQCNVVGEADFYFLQDHKDLLFSEVTIFVK